jgi:hypothetical protein
MDTSRDLATTRADLLTFLALDLDFSIPANSHQFGQTSSIILIAFIHAYG